MNPKWEVWSEGWRATGEYGRARYVGSIVAETFQDACDKIYLGDPLYNSERRSYWACKLYPTEKEARELFG